MIPVAGTVKVYQASSSRAYLRSLLSCGVTACRSAAERKPYTLAQPPHSTTLMCINIHTVCGYIVQTHNKLITCVYTNVTRLNDLPLR